MRAFSPSSSSCAFIHVINALSTQYSATDTVCVFTRHTGALSFTSRTFTSTVVRQLQLQSLFVLLFVYAHVSDGTPPSVACTISSYCDTVSRSSGRIRRSMPVFLSIVNVSVRVAKL